MLTSFKPFHVYTLRKSLGSTTRPQRVLLITAPQFADRRQQETLSVLPLSAVNRPVESDIRVKILSPREGGSAELDCTHYCAIDGILPIQKINLIAHSGSEILEEEKREIRRKLGDYLGLSR
ncbi:hypothetical protein GGR27_002761 [Lewinella antarctica]|uniref:Type II toxin-antitoxin system PemK/MazF family toxin n=1 Tax=Neolewinella antarctica TaxID=442734 RepID=A0ABX0XD70_9BACT|nr:hypothetical protein [Neolewinella antarctica]